MPRPDFYGRAGRRLLGMERTGRRREIGRGMSPSGNIKKEHLPRRWGRAKVAAGRIITSAPKNLRLKKAGFNLLECRDQEGVEGTFFAGAGGCAKV